MRSLLFIPSDRAAAYLPKAIAAAPDAIVFDLEDSVAPNAKEAARDSLAAILDDSRPEIPVLLRINQVGSPWFREDVATAVGLRMDGIVVPKCETGDDVHRVTETVRLMGATTSDALALIPTVETPLGILAAHEVGAAHPAVTGLAFGAEDLAATLGIHRTASGREVFVARSHVVLAAAAARIWAVDSPTLEYRRLDVVRRDAVLARALGFIGKLLIHPAQVDPVHDAFRVSARELEDAERIVAAMEALGDDSGRSRGVTSLDGRMVDRPVYIAATRTIRRAALQENRSVKDLWKKEDNEHA